MRYKKIYQLGGELSFSDLTSGFGAATGMLATLGEATQMGNEPMDPTSAGWLSAFRGAGTGAQLGNKILPGIGGVVGAGIGGIIGGITGKKAGTQAMRDYHNQKREVQVANARRERNINNNYLRSFPTEGVVTNSYFAEGGNLPFRLLGETSKVIGPKHEKGGVKLPGGVEVEGGEIISKGKVFSDRVIVPGTDKTFADVAEEVATTKEYKKTMKLRDKYLQKFRTAGFNQFKRGTAERGLTTLDDPLDDLFNIQETMKADNNQQIMAEGGSILGAISDVAPYLDNAVNAIITARSPRIPAPVLTEAPKLDTTYNVQPQLAAIDRTASARDTQLGRVTRNSATLRSNLIAGDVNDIYARNQVLGQKENIETQLRNQQAQLSYQNELGNVNALNDFRYKNFQRTDDIHNRISANAANLVEDIRFQQRERNQEKLDKQRMALTAMQYMQSGVLDRSGYAMVLQALENGASLEEAMNLVARRQPQSTTTLPTRNGIPSFQAPNIRDLVPRTSPPNTTDIFRKIGSATGALGRTGLKALYSI